MDHSIINQTMKYWGKKPICNLHEDRAPHIGSFCLPLCWRCTGITLSTITMIIIFNIFPLQVSLSTFILGIILLLPCAADGILQMFLGMKSNNFRRILTGILCGIAIVLIAECVEYLILSMMK